MKKLLTAIVIVAMLLTLSIPTTAATSNTNSIEYSELVTPPSDIDANGKIDTADLVQCRLMLLGKKEVNDLADANNDGDVDIRDLICIKYIIIG